MTRQLEQSSEDRASRRSKAILQAVEGGLEDALARSGTEYTGFTAKISAVECLLVIKGVLAGRPQVAFVGSATLGDALVKAVRLGNRDELRWKPDKYRT